MRIRQLSVILACYCFSGMFITIWLMESAIWNRGDYLSIIPMLAVIIFTFIARTHQRSWVAPGSFFLLIWMLAILFTVVFAPDYEVKYTALCFIAIGSIIVYSGTVFGSVLVGKCASPYANNKNIQSHFNVLVSVDMASYFNKLVLLSSIIGFLSIIVLLNSINKSISDLFSIQGIVAIGSQLSAYRYNSGMDYQQPILYSLLMPGIYAGSLFAGALFAVKKNSIVSYLPFCIAILNSIVKTNRTTILFSLILWFASYTSLNVWISPFKIKVFTKKFIIFIIGLSLFFIVVYILLQMSREGVTDDSLYGAALLTLKTAAFGSIPSFSSWFDTSFLERFDLTFGEFTFNRIYFYLFDIPQRAPGLFGDTHYLGQSYREATTIYTVFRALIQDFSLLGALIFLFFTGILGGSAFSRVIDGHINAIPVLTLFYSFSVIGYLVSIFVFNGLILSFFIYFTAFFLKGARWNQRL